MSKRGREKSKIDAVKKIKLDDKYDSGYKLLTEFTSRDKVVVFNEFIRIWRSFADSAANTSIYLNAFMQYAKLQVKLVDIVEGYDIIIEASKGKPNDNFKLFFSDLVFLYEKLYETISQENSICAPLNIKVLQSIPTLTKLILSGLQKGKGVNFLIMQLCYMVLKNSRITKQSGVVEESFRLLTPFFVSIKPSFKALNDDNFKASFALVWVELIMGLGVTSLSELFDNNKSLISFILKFVSFSNNNGLKEELIKALDGRILTKNHVNILPKNIKNTFLENNSILLLKMARSNEACFDFIKGVLCSEKNYKFGIALVKCFDFSEKKDLDLATLVASKITSLEKLVNFNRLIYQNQSYNQCKNEAIGNKESYKWIELILKLFFSHEIHDLNRSSLSNYSLSDVGAYVPDFNRSAINKFLQSKDVVLQLSTMVLLNSMRKRLRNFCSCAALSGEDFQGILAKVFPDSALLLSCLFNTAVQSKSIDMTFIFKTEIIKFLEVFVEFQDDFLLDFGKILVMVDGLKVNATDALKVSIMNLMKKYFEIENNSDQILPLLALVLERCNFDSGSYNESIIPFLLEKALNHKKEADIHLSALLRCSPELIKLYAAAVHSVDENRFELLDSWYDFSCSLQNCVQFSLLFWALLVKCEETYDFAPSNYISFFRIFVGTVVMQGNNQVALRSLRRRFKFVETMMTKLETLHVINLVDLVRQNNLDGRFIDDFLVLKLKGGKFKLTLEDLNVYLNCEVDIDVVVLLFQTFYLIDLQLSEKLVLFLNSRNELLKNDNLRQAIKNIFDARLSNIKDTLALKLFIIYDFIKKGDCDSLTQFLISRVGELDYQKWIDDIGKTVLIDFFLKNSVAPLWLKDSDNVDDKMLYFLAKQKRIPVNILNSLKNSDYFESLVNIILLIAQYLQYNDELTRLVKLLLTTHLDLFLGFDDKRRLCLLDIVMSVEHHRSTINRCFIRCFSLVPEMDGLDHLFVEKLLEWIEKKQAECNFEADELVLFLLKLLKSNISQHKTIPVYVDRILCLLKFNVAKLNDHQLMKFRKHSYVLKSIVIYGLKYCFEYPVFFTFVSYLFGRQCGLRNLILSELPVVLLLEMVLSHSKWCIIIKQRDILCEVLNLLIVLIDILEVGSEYRGVNVLVKLAGYLVELLLKEDLQTSGKIVKILYLIENKEMLSIYPIIKHKFNCASNLKNILVHLNNIDVKNVTLDMNENDDFGTVLFKISLLSISRDFEYQENDLDLQGIIDNNGLAFALIALSCYDLKLRKLGYYILGKFNQIFEQSFSLASVIENSEKAKKRIFFGQCLTNLKGKKQIFLLLHSLRNAITSSFQRIPFIMALFLTQAVHILQNPKSNLYLLVNKFFLKNELLDLYDIPLFFDTFFSCDQSSHRDFKLFILKLVKFGLKDGEYAFTLIQKRHVYELLLFCLSSEDYGVKNLVMEVFRTILNLLKANSKSNQLRKFLVSGNAFVFVYEALNAGIAREQDLSDLIQLYPELGHFNEKFLCIK